MARKGMPRDSYRYRVLAAEADVAWRKISGQDMINLRSTVLKSRWWAAHAKPTSSLGYFKTHNGEFSCPCGNYEDIGSLMYARPGSPLLHLMHAMAHHTVDYTIGEPSVHGPEFAKAYLVIVKRFLGQNVRDSLAVAFAQHKVKTRTWSPEAKQAAKHRSAVKELKAMRDELSR